MEGLTSERETNRCLDRQTDKQTDRRKDRHRVKVRELERERERMSEQTREIMLANKRATESRSSPFIRKAPKIDAPIFTASNSTENKDTYINDFDINKIILCLF